MNVWAPEKGFEMGSVLMTTILSHYYKYIIIFWMSLHSV